MNRRADEALIARINQLPPERRAQIEDFVNFLAAQERRREAAEALRAMWAELPQEELTPEIEQMIVEEVRAVRAEKRAARGKSGRADRS
jgi:predicted metal-dependent hydrolase